MRNLSLDIYYLILRYKGLNYNNNNKTPGRTKDLGTVVVQGNTTAVFTKEAYNFGLLVNVRPNFAKNGFLALKEISWVGNVEKINLHLRLNGWFAPHFVCLTTDFQDQLLYLKQNYDLTFFFCIRLKRESQTGGQILFKNWSRQLNRKFNWLIFLEIFSGFKRKTRWKFRTTICDR